MPRLHLRDHFISKVITLVITTHKIAEYIRKFRKSEILKYLLFHQNDRTVFQMFKNYAATSKYDNLSSVCTLNEIL